MSAGGVRVADPCPVCGARYGLSDLATDSEGRIVHYLCEPGRRAEWLALIESVEYVR